MKKYIKLDGNSISKATILKICSHKKFWKTFNNFGNKFKSTWSLIKYDNLLPWEAYQFLFKKIFYRSSQKNYYKTTLKLFNNSWEKVEFVEKKLRCYLDEKILKGEIVELDE